MSLKKEVDVILINPGDRAEMYQSLGENLSAAEPPVWVGLIATYLRKKGISTHVIDSYAENLTPHETAQRVADINPELICIVAYGHQPSASTQVMPSARGIAEEILFAAPGQNILFVGGHVAALPKQTLKEEDCCDFVCTGEGPITIYELIQVIKNKETNFAKVRGLIYRTGRGVVTTRPAPLVTNLDEEMPGLAWDLLPMHLYRAHNWHCFGDVERIPYGSLYTTLGCPYHCMFCCIQSPFKTGEQALGYKPEVNSYRYWSPETVIAEIDILVERYGVKNIRFADEMFVLNMNHVNRICDLIIERGYDLNIWAYARIDTIRKEGIAEKLKKAGINWLCFGIEAADDNVRENVDKGYGKYTIEDTIKKVREAGIYVLANYIFGLPEDTHDSMQRSLDQAVWLNCEFANFYAAMAYPGSELYRIAQKEGWPLPKKWSGYSHHSVDTLPLPTRYLSGQEVLRFRDYAWQTYFTNPRYLTMITKTFGEKTRKHIEEMASKKLVRHYA